MKKRSFVDFEAIKAAVNITQVLEHYGLADQFKKSNNGDSWSGPCPIHQGTNPTQFRVSVSKNCWHCFSGDCHAHGNVLEFVSRMENISISQAARKLAEWFKIDAEWKPDTTRRDKPARTEEAKSSASEEASAPQPAAKAETRPASRVESLAKADEIGSNKKLNFELQHLDAAHPYLTERGLTPETIAEFGLGFCAKGSMKDRVVIPIHNSAGELVAYAGRWPGEPSNGEPKYNLPGGFKKSAELFNLHRAIREPAERPLVVVEGFFGAMWLHQLGVRKVVALMGSILSPAQEELITRHSNSRSNVLVMLDEDDAGRFGREQMVMRLCSRLFVSVFKFGAEDFQPERMSREDVAELIGSVS
jgi:DNA primase